jgi:hypothetical protein
MAANDAKTELAHAEAKQARLGAEAHALREQLPAWAVSKLRQVPQADAQYAAGKADLRAKEEALADVAILIGGLRLEADAQEHKAAGLARCIELARDAEQDFVQRRRRLLEAGPSAASDAYEKCFAAHRRSSGRGNALYALTGNRTFQVRSGLRELFGDQFWPAFLACGAAPNAPKPMLTETRAWLDALAAAKGEAAPGDRSTVED